MYTISKRIALSTLSLYTSLMKIVYIIISRSIKYLLNISRLQYFLRTSRDFIYQNPEYYNVRKSSCIYRYLIIIKNNILTSVRRVDRVKADVFSCAWAGGGGETHHTDF